MLRTALQNACRARRKARHRCCPRATTTYDGTPAPLACGPWPSSRCPKPHSVCALNTCVGVLRGFLHRGLCDTCRQVGGRSSLGGVPGSYLTTLNKSGHTLDPSHSLRQITYVQHQRPREYCDDGDASVMPDADLTRASNVGQTKTGTVGHFLDCGDWPGRSRSPFREGDGTARLRLFYGTNAASWMPFSRSVPVAIAAQMTSLMPPEIRPDSKLRSAT